jgi:hypothetical protein
VNCYEVVPARLWVRDDGATASIYGAVPWVSEVEKARWAIVLKGFTVRNPLTGQVGVGRPPEATVELAQALAKRLGRPSNICIGD